MADFPEDDDTRDDLPPAEGPVSEDAPTAFHRVPDEAERSAPPVDDIDTDHHLAAPPVRDDALPAWQQPEPGEEDKKTSFFERERMHGSSGPAPLEQEVPEEHKRTEFFERDKLLAKRKGGRSFDAHEEMPTIIVDSDKEKAAIAPPRRIGETTEKHARPKQGERSGPPIAILVGVACLVVGVVVGVSTALLMGEDEPPTETRAEPEPEPPAPTPTPEPEPEPEVATPEEGTPEATAATPSEEAPTEPVEEPVTPDAYVAQIETALDAADAETAATTIETARPIVEAPRIRRLEARLMVLRGDGALAVQRLTTLTEAFEDAPLFTALGRVLAQAEQDGPAARAFQRAIAIDDGEVDAHIGLTHIRARALSLSAARGHLRDAQAAAGEGEDVSHITRARLKVAEASIELEEGNLDEAAERAREALDLDPASSEASLVLARIAVTRGTDPERPLRAAVSGRAPAPVALAMLATRVQGDQACELAARYLQRAPRGYDASALRRIDSRCQR